VKSESLVRLALIKLF